MIDCSFPSLPVFAGVITCVCLISDARRRRVRISKPHFSMYSTLNFIDSDIHKFFFVPENRLLGTSTTTVHYEVRRRSSV